MNRKSKYVTQLLEIQWSSAKGPQSRLDFQPQRQEAPRLKILLGFWQGAFLATPRVERTLSYLWGLKKLHAQIQARMRAENETSMEKSNLVLPAKGSPLVSGAA